jgi:hypothetical protein
MASSEEIPAARPGPVKASKRPAAAPPTAAEALVVVTLKVSDGSILKIEATDPGGARHELTAAEAAKLLGDRPNSTVEGLVHQAFEAGIACVLDESPAGAAADEASGESREDAILHDELLGALIERSPAKRLLRREVLNSALLGTIISGASGGTPAAAE